MLMLAEFNSFVFRIFVLISPVLRKASLSGIEVVGSYIAHP